MASSRWAMTRQTWVAATAAVALVVCALVLAVTPVPFVIWSPGRTLDLLAPSPSKEAGHTMIEVLSIPTYPSSGQLLLLTISETRNDQSITLPEALWAYWAPGRDALPRELLFSPGKTSDQIETEDRARMLASRENATVAALYAAGADVKQYPQVGSVVSTGPAAGQLNRGDYIYAVDGKAVNTPQQVNDMISQKRVNEKVTFNVLRGEESLSAIVTVAAANRSRDTPVIGVQFQQGYRYLPAVVDFHVPDSMGGSSAGLMFALALYEKITRGDLVAGRIIAGTGEITEAGSVRPIGGVQEKISAAESRSAEIFLLPAENCREAEGVSTSMRIVKVTSLSQAVQALKDLRDPERADQVPTC